MIVLIWIGIEKIIQHKTAVNINSIALANIFKIEFKFFKNKLVVIPASALLKIIKRTGITNTCDSDCLLNADINSPLKYKSETLQIIESTYINIFCIKIFTSAPLSLSKYSL